MINMSATDKIKLSNTIVTVGKFAFLASSLNNFS